MWFPVFVIIAASTSDITSTVERLIARYDMERPVLPYRVDITDEERISVAQKHRLAPDSPALRDKLSIWCGYPCNRDEQGYFYLSTGNPNGHWDTWVLNDIQTDVYQLPDDALKNIDPLAVVTPDGVWHEMPNQWNETTQQIAQRHHLTQQLLSQYAEYTVAVLHCHC